MRRLIDDVAIIGWACRFPGARSISELWSVLIDGRCTVTEVPSDRFPLDRFGHVRRQERGKSYTWAAGVLDNVFDFDPELFGIAPREAEQMDPQQRLLLELTWEAFEDAGIRPSRLAGQDVGVFVGASLTDYGNILSGDPAVADAQFATGNALAILSNRISYIFDLRGPSLTIDTACSSSLVALHQAVEALRSGRIDTAIVGGVNIIASPAAFISFSQASMLSPTGRCRAFSADADGFVRAEGGAVLILRKAALAQTEKNPLHGFVLASDVNSDGRTSGILLPSGDAQEELISRIYARAKISATRLAFVEAHGTGTPVGDPIEANAIGRSLGRFRSNALPIGSIKTNIGHLEPASGIAGVIKSVLSLNHGILPRSLHFSAANPRIDFEGLGLRTAQEPILLPDAATQCAGVNSFGFGGTNAHVVLAQGRNVNGVQTAGSKYFFISAKSGSALRELASDYRSRLANTEEADVNRVAAVAAYRREQLEHGLIAPLENKHQLLTRLDQFIAGESVNGIAVGEAIARDMPVAFVYSGNGGQWAGMGTAAYRGNEAFRNSFDEVDRLFTPLSGWSLFEMLASAELSTALDQTQVAQPLIFAIQVATTVALQECGVLPCVMLGHSVGEVAAAHASGALDLNTAVKVIFNRSKHQELARGRGRMAALAVSFEQAACLIAGVRDVEIAAFNSPHSVTVAGTVEGLAIIGKRAREESVAMLDLGLDYPFHTAAMDELKDALVEDLKHVTGTDGSIPFVSTVTGQSLPGSRLDARYWWQNVRDPVRFEEAVREAAREGARCFIEIGPRGVLYRHVSDILKDHADPIFSCGSLDREEGEGDPFPAILSNILLAGGKVDFNKAFGRDPGSVMSLPHYPWQRQHYRFTPTVEAHGTLEPNRSRYGGARYSQHDCEWHSHIDSAKFPELRDHRVGEQIIFPGAGFLEVVLSVAREFLRSDHIVLSDFEILKPLDLSASETRHLMTRVSPAANIVEILSRPRLVEGEWLLNCRGKISHGQPLSDVGKIRSSMPGGTIVDGAEIYRLAEKYGLHYGPAFRHVTRARRKGDRIAVDLCEGSKFENVSLDPSRLDACSHGMLLIFDELQAQERGVTYIPVRIDEMSLFKHGEVIQHAVIDIVSKSERSIVVNYSIFAADGTCIASLRGVRAQAIPIRRPTLLNANAVLEVERLITAPITGVRLADASVPDSSTEVADQAELVLEAWALAAMSELLSLLAQDGLIDHRRLLRERLWPQDAADLLFLLLDRMCSAGLAIMEGEYWRLIDTEALPSAKAMLMNLHADHPDRARDLLITGAVTCWLDKVRDERRVSDLHILSKSSLSFRALVGTAERRRSAHLIDMMDKMVNWPSDRALRILHLGCNPGTPALAAAIGARDAMQTIFVPDLASIDDVTERRLQGIALVDKWPEQNFDLVLSVDSLSQQEDSVPVHALLAPGGRLFAIEGQPNVYEDLITGLSSSMRRIRRSPSQWVDALNGIGFRDISALPIGSADQAITALSGKVVQAQQPTPLKYLVVANNCRPDIVEGIRAALSLLAASHAETTACIYLLPEDLESSDAIADACMNLKAFAEEQINRAAIVWIVFRGGRDRAANRALWTFTRVLANEFPNLDIRRAWLCDGARDIEALANNIVSGSAETDIIIANGVSRALRVESVTPAREHDRPMAEAARLQRQQDLVDRVRWMPQARKAPADGEVEIAVEATGLNFRDVMWMLGLLPDDILEGGFAGPGLGLECAGRVIRIGAKVDSLKVGDRVVGFIPSAFSTHVTVGATHVMPIPQGLTAEAAATIPVAFLTAYYGLVTLGKLRAGEWVLIHAAAGAVGLAAIQVAQARRAKIIATAGSPAKRDMLKALGITHVLDSRSLAFVDDIRRIRPDGVDIVLNSLAGEAMERSITCLRPFGRFIELGKRDYVANTHIGLRPLRNNVSYFGVDVDQLVGRQAVLGRKVFRSIMQSIENATYRPLPYSVFAAGDTQKAFSAMQTAAHIGKIVVTPPVSVPATEPAFRIAPDRTHLVTGGLAGFGLATARWLVERGARHLVLISRSGPSTAEAKEALENFRGCDVNVLAASCDVTNEIALRQLFTQIESEMPPLCGIMHAAMVLDDAVISNLDRERFLRVLLPKMTGAQNLDRLTRGLPLDYFVLFSSITTVFGNPGQGNYVLANGYLEGIARQRKAAGLPALAIGFGAISDVGVVARSQALQENLSRISGARGMKSADALELMGQALQRFGDDPEVATVAISPNDGSFVFGRLPVLRSPTFASFMSKRSSVGETGIIDLRQLLKEKNLNEIRQTVAGLVADQVARVLRAREETLSHSRALAEMGLDSLMALELALNLEKTLGIEVPLTVSTADITIAKLADRIVALAGGGRIDADDRASAMVGPHLQDVRPEQIDALGAIITAGKG